MGYHNTDTNTCTFTNVYWNETNGLGFYGKKDTENQRYNQTEAKTAQQFENGEVAYLLGEKWGQKIGTDPYPVINGKKVFVSEGTYFNIDDFEITTAAQNGAKADATLKIAEAGTYSLIIADYEGGRLNNLERITQEFDGGIITVTSTKDITLGKDDKIMIWKDLTNLAPLCEAYIVE